MSFLRRNTAVLATLIACPLAALAQPLAVPQHVPEAPLAIISFGDVNAFWNAYSKTALKGHFDQLVAQFESEGQAGFKEMREELDKASAEAGLSLQPEDFLGKTLKGVDLYVMKPTAAATEAGLEDPGFVASLKLDSPESAAKLATWLTRKATEVDPPYVWTDPTAEATPTPAPTPTPLPTISNEVGGFAVTEVAAGDGDLPFNIAQKGDVILLANDKDLLASTITSQGTAALAADPQFQAAYSSLAGQQGQMFVYVATGDIMKLAAEGSGEIDPATIDAQPPVAAIGRVDGTNLEVTTRSLVPAGADPTIVKLMSIAPGPVASLVKLAAPQSLMSVGANVLEGEALYDYAVEQARKTSPEGASELESQLASVDEALGMSLRDDVLAAFGPVGSFHLNGIRYGGGFDVEVDSLVALQVRDDEKAQRVMATLRAAVLDSVNAQLEEGATPLDATTMSHAGVEITLVPVSPQPLPVPVQPGMYSARVGDTQLMALTEAGIKAAIDRAAGTAPGGTELMARTGLAGNYANAANTFSWIDFGGFAATLRTAIPTVVGMSGGDAAMQSQMELVANVIEDLGTVSATQTNDPAGQTGMVVWKLK